MTDFKPLEEAERLGTRLIEAIHEARVVTKDLRSAIAEARTVQRELQGQVAEIVDKEISTEVAKGLDEYKESLTKAIEKAEASVQKRFDDLADILLGEDAKTKRQGKASIPELARQKYRRTSGA